MKNILIFTVALSSSLWLSACSDNKDKQETVIEPQLKALEKAQNVENVLQQKDADLRKRLEEQSR